MQQDEWSRRREMVEEEREELRDAEVPEECLSHAIRELKILLVPLSKKILENDPTARFDDDTDLAKTFLFASQGPDLVPRLEYVTTVALSQTGVNPIRLILGCGIRMKVSSVLEFRTLIYLGYTQTAGRIDSWEPSPTEVACATLATDGSIADMVKEVEVQFSDWLGKFNDVLDTSS